MRCHYEVLVLARDASASEVKRAFHVQARQWHPDKHRQHGISPEEATTRFQEIQSAYEVLSDAQERKWYDEHREQILRGDADGDGSGGDEDAPHELNLFRFFRTSVYSGFADDDPDSFYGIYGALFAKIDALDLESASFQSSSSSKRSPSPAPVLGQGMTPIEDVRDFYAHWQSYVTSRPFAHVDEYKTTDAPTRVVRRAMEKENKKLRDAARKAFTGEVRALVEFVCKRDPRMIAFVAERERQRVAQQALEEKRRRDKQQAFEAQRDAFQQEQQARWAAMKEQGANGDDLEAGARTSRHAEQDVQEELAKLRRKLDAELLLCDLCNKTFKSRRQLQNHVVSKKHRERELELGIAPDSEAFELLDEAMDRELQEELAQLKMEKSVAGRRGEKEGEEEEEEEEAQEKGEGGAEEDEAAVARAQAQREKEEEAARLRLEKEQKAAEKRQERKLQRKEKKKNEVEKIVSSAKAKGKAGNKGAVSGRDKDEGDSDSDGGRGRRKAGKNKKKR